MAEDFGASEESWTYVGKPYNVSDKILAEFDWTPLLIESEDGNLIENPRYYELE